MLRVLYNDLINCAPFIAKEYNKLKQFLYCFLFEQKAVHGIINHLDLRIWERKDQRKLQLFFFMVIWLFSIFSITLGAICRMLTRTFHRNNEMPCMNHIHKKTFRRSERVEFKIPMQIFRYYILWHVALNCDFPNLNHTLFENVHKGKIHSRLWAIKF